jgi:hypothetical protein
MLNRHMVRWPAPALAFVGSALVSCAGMRLFCDHSDLPSPVANALLAVLFSACTSWSALSHWRHVRPILCWAAVGVSSGIGGAGTFVLMLHFLASLIKLCL